MKCPACGEQNREDAFVCVKCRHLFRIPPKLPDARQIVQSRRFGQARLATRVSVLVSLGAAVAGSAVGLVAVYVGERRPAAPAGAATAPAEPGAPPSVEPAPSSQPAGATRTPAGAIFSLIEEPPEPPPPRLAPPSYWHEGAEGYRRAQEEQKRARTPMILYFHAPWVPNCRRFENEIFDAAVTRQFLADVVKVRIEPEASIANQAFAATFGVTGFPVVFVIPDAGARAERISTFLSEPEDSDVRAEKFVAVCRNVARNQARERVLEGGAAVRAGDLITARAALDLAIALDPENAEAHRWRGIIKTRLGEPGRALGDFRRAIALAPQDPDAYSSVAEVYREAGLVDDALAALSDLVRVAPDWQRGLPFLLRSHLYRKRGDSGLAQADLQDACRRGQEAACASLGIVPPQ